jgi:hypothetical protein
LYRKLVVNFIKYLYKIKYRISKKKKESKILTFPQVVAEVLNLKGGRVDAKKSGLVLFNFAEDGGEALIDR